VTTYTAKDPSRYIEASGSTDDSGPAPLQGYKMEVNGDETAYDSFVLVFGRWMPAKVSEPLDEKARMNLRSDIVSGHLIESN
jgi:hypothetical protein